MDKDNVNILELLKFQANRLEQMEKSLRCMEKQLTTIVITSKLLVTLLGLGYLLQAIFKFQ